MTTTNDNGPVILFQGDSITDTDRNRQNDDDLGHGYAIMASAWYQALFPERMARFINRGMGGNTVKDLHARWRQDCIDLQPDLVSVLIGINDTARLFDGRDTTSVEGFEATYRDILTQTKAIGAELVLMEPYLLPYPEDRQIWRKELDSRIHVVRSLAREFHAAFVPLDGIFAHAATRRDPTFWAADGVHPSPAGHALIAQAWLDAAQDLI